MKIVIDNVQLEYNMGCRLLKLKHESCPFPELEDIWLDIKPMSFREISEIKNLEIRRVGINALGLERLIKEVNPTLVNKRTLKKETTWVNEKGELINKKYSDTYELYKVSGEVFSKGLEYNQKMSDSYYVKFKDTSTDREYLLWVDVNSVAKTNDIEKENKINAIQCIAWSIQTNVPIGNIEKILRQGDCILIKPKGKYEKLEAERHLTENEYLTLLVAES